MPYAVLEKKVKALPEEAFNLVMRYVDEVCQAYKNRADSCEAREGIARSLFGALDDTVLLDEAVAERLERI